LSGSYEKEIPPGGDTTNFATDGNDNLSGLVLTGLLLLSMGLSRLCFCSHLLSCLCACGADGTVEVAETVDVETVGIVAAITVVDEEIVGVEAVDVEAVES
jgi:hypothetical protein